MLDEIDNLLDNAINAHEAKNFEKAAFNYTKILEKDAHHADANHNFGLLTVEIGLEDQALIFLQTAVNANPNVLQYWVTLINTLLNLDRIDDAEVALKAANSLGHRDVVFDQLKHNLEMKQRGVINQETLVADYSQTEKNFRASYDPIINNDKSGECHINILEKMKLGNAIKLAKEKAEDGYNQEAKQIYKDILEKFPKNRKAIDGIKALKGSAFVKKSKLQDPPFNIIQPMITLYKKGLMQRVITECSQLLTQFPNSVTVYNMIGAANQSLGNLEESVEAYRAAISIKPDYAIAYNNIGNTLSDQGKIEEAIENYKKAISIKPDYAEAFYNMGNALQSRSKFKQAIKAYKKALSVKPNYTNAYNNMGNALQATGKMDDAIECYEKVLHFRPHYAEALINKGVALNELGKHEQAIEAYDNAISINPEYAEAYYNKGVTLRDLGKRQEALGAYYKAVSLNIDYAEAYNNIGVVLKELGKPDEAIAAYKKALSIRPEYAEAHQNLSFLLLNIGKLEQGLNEYEWRWKTLKNSTKKRTFGRPLWDGKTDLTHKTVLVWGEQGPQDMTVWSSALKYINARSEHCILECPDKLVSLFRRSFPELEVRSENETEDKEFHFHLPMGSLYDRFHNQISNRQITEPYLRTDNVRVQYWRDRLNELGGKIFIGISWKSPLITPARMPNYTDILEWEPVLAIPNLTFINLQSTDFDNDLQTVYDQFGIKVHNFDDLDHYDNLDEVGALCRALDMCITVSTAVGAIAAGVGTPTKVATWRQSPWNNPLLAPYGPFVETYERNTWETWAPVFDSLANDIKVFFSKDL